MSLFVKELRLYIVVDPANAKNKRADFTNMWVWGTALDQNIYVIDGVRDKLDQRERWDAILKLHQKWNDVSRIRCVGWEQYSLQTDIEYIRAKQKKINYRFEITPLGGNVKKEDRIRGLVGMFKDGQIYFCDEIDVITLKEKRNLTKDFRDIEYSKYPATRHDDMLDSLARIRDMIGLGYATFPKKVNQDTSEFYRKRHERTQGIGWMGR